MKRLSRTEPVAAVEVARLGEELRDARVAMGLSLDDVAAALRIRRVYLVALEEGRARDLPAPAYAIGFVRSYARALGLDDNEMVRRFRESGSTVAPRKTDLVFPEPVPERGVPAGALVLAGAVVVIGAYVGWWHWSGSGERSVDAVPPPPPRIEDLATLREPPPPEPAATPSAPAAAAVLPAARPGLAPGGTAPPPAAPPPPTTATPAIPVPRPPDENRVTLRARSGDVWVQVRERVNGPILFDRVLKVGETYSVPNRDTALVLNTGNANGLEISVDGQPTPGGLGAGPNTRRGQSLDPERLKAIPAPQARPAAGAPAQSAANLPTAPSPAAAGGVPAPRTPAPTAAQAPAAQRPPPQ